MNFGFGQGNKPAMGVSSWVGTGAAVALYGGAAIIMAGLTLVVCYMWLMEPWLALNALVRPTAVTAGLIARFFNGVLFTIVTGFGAFAFFVAQFYQSQHVLANLGLRTPETKEQAALRIMFYAVEGLVTLHYKLGDDIGGWSGDAFASGLKVLGYLMTKPVSLIFTLLTVAAMTMAAEYMFGYTVAAFNLAKVAIQAQKRAKAYTVPHSPAGGEPAWKNAAPGGRQPATPPGAGMPDPAMGRAQRRDAANV